MSSRAVMTNILATGLAMGLAGCVPGADDEPRTPGPAPAPETAPSAWREADASPVVAVPADVDDAALAAAIAEARATLDEARIRWEITPAAARDRWAVKWAAPTADGAIEYVWVRPMHWSPFRIEGRLASPPQRPLAAHHEQGDLVGFPADEAVDWMHETATVREGAFTVRVLEARYGLPR